MTSDTNNFPFLTKNASRMMDCSGYIKLNISCHSNLYVFTQYTAFFNRETKTRDFMCPDPFKVHVLRSFVSMATNLPSIFLNQLLKFLVNITLLKYVKSLRSYGFLITEEFFFGFQILNFFIRRA